VIRRLLVANRGDVARRIFATCRLIGIETVAVFSDADADCPHVADADWAVHLPGNAPTATYLRADLIIAAARKAGADAVHPGWGFLACDPQFATAVVDAGLTWVGPPAKTLVTLGDRRAAAARLAEAEIPVLPSWDDPDRVDRFPVLVKPVRGGGGRAIRLAHDPAGLAEAVAAARREAVAAYGDGTVYCEQFVPRARHVDIQLMADAHGNAITFGERECSVQRRHQQLVAEAPSPAVTPQLREQLCGVAIKAAAAVGWVGAGTAEFLLAPDGRCWVLELSPRLSAEHAVTECVSGVDLVRLQLLAAEGAPLPFPAPPPIRGHAIGVRLLAEDPAYAWLPTTGTLHRFTIGAAGGTFGPLAMPGLRVDAAATGGTTVGLHYDSTLATLVAWAPTRYEAARLLAAALARAQIHGVVTNRDLLVRTLRHPTFLAGTVDTAFLDEHPEVFAPLPSSVDSVRLSCLAAALSGAAQRRAAARVWGGGLPSGWRNVPSGAQTAVFGGPAGPVEIGYRLDRTGELAHWWVRAVDPDELELAGLGQPSTLPDDHPPVAVVAADAGRVVLDVAGVRMAFSVHRVTVGPPGPDAPPGHDAPTLSYVDSAEGSVVLTELPRWPVPAPADGALVAPLSGAVASVHVVPGQRVAAGELLVTLDANATAHPVHAPAPGVVAEVPIGPGARVDAGTVLAVLTPE
jgi:propionyl-CoA carboxylase alpha chain